MKKLNLVKNRGIQIMMDRHEDGHGESSDCRHAIAAPVRLFGASVKKPRISSDPRF